jgi:hypothetical protein
MLAVGCRGCCHRAVSRPHDLKDAAGNGYPDGDEDRAAEQLAPLADLGAEPVPSPGPARDKVTLAFAASVVMLVTGHP